MHSHQQSLQRLMGPPGRNAGEFACCCPTGERAQTLLSSQHTVSTHDTPPLQLEKVGGLEAPLQPACGLPGQRLKCHSRSRLSQPYHPGQGAGVQREPHAVPYGKRPTPGGAPPTPSCSEQLPSLRAAAGWAHSSLGTHRVGHSLGLACSCPVCGCCKRRRRGGPAQGPALSPPPLASKHRRSPRSCGLCWGPGCQHPQQKRGPHPLMSYHVEGNPVHHAPPMQDCWPS
mmetsp:Transcript_27305/g.73808  ORF Transcript_27305/g.73808 Transcript_27305/m.73808 type:complete len:229 (+) Transcript_27305:939-1625(+)